MKHAIRICSTFAASAIAACFGSGPIPSAPSRAQILYSAPLSTANCSDYYIGDVAYGSAFGYAIVIPYVPQENNCNGGGGGTAVTLNIQQFDKTTGAVTDLGTAGTSTQATTNQEPRIIATGSGAVWTEFNAGGALTLGPSGITVGSNAGTPIGLAADGSAIYVATANVNSATSINDPDYPCCGNSPGGSGGQGAITAVTTGATGLATVSFACGVATHCLAANQDSLFYFEQPNTGPASVTKLPKTGGASTSVGAIASSFVTAAAGITATPTTVAWSATVDYTSSSASASEQGCVIAMSDLTAATPNQKVLLSTTKFSCLGLSIDGNDPSDNAAYFAIISPIASDNNGGGGGANVYIHGDGIGRITLDGSEFDSIDVGIIGATSGPRRVHSDGDSVYAIDPDVIAKILKSDIVGHHDFTQ